MEELKNITIFRDFIEDQRTSMEVYADNIILNINELGKNNFKIREFRPQPSNWVKKLPEAFLQD